MLVGINSKLKEYDGVAVMGTGFQRTKAKDLTPRLEPAKTQIFLLYSFENQHQQMVETYYFFRFLLACREVNILPDVKSNPTILE